MRFLISLIVMLMICAAAFSATIYQIQYTTTPGTGSTYPSPLDGQVVSTEGIVTGVGFTGGKYVISEGAGAWKGIFVNDPTHSPQLGDRITITGTVTEINGFTEIGSVTAFEIVDSGNPIPAATIVTPTNLQGYPNYTGEAYEGVLVKATNVKVTLIYSTDIFYVSAVSGSATTCQINDGFFPTAHTWGGIVVNQIWAEITGLVYYSSPNPPQYRINPRDEENDMVPSADINTISLKLEEVEAKKGETKSVNVTVSRLDENWNLKSYKFKLGFNKRIVRFVDVDFESTLSDNYPAVTLSTNEDSVTVIYQSDNALASTTNNGVLIKLLFETLSYGETVLDLTQSSFNDSINTYTLVDGKIVIPIKKKLAWLSIYNDNYNKKNIFNPWLNQKIMIEYGCLVESGIPAAKAIIRIYDSQGRLVATPINKIINTANGIEYLLWNGRDRNKNLLPIGVYYCHLEIIDRVTGKSETTIQPIVVAAKLK